MQIPKNILLVHQHQKIQFKIKILDKQLHFKLLIQPDLYLGEAYTEGKIVIENGTLTDFLDLALMNIGRKEYKYNKLPY